MTLSQISGPLGFWRFPILNLLLSILGTRTAQSSASSVAFENIEEIVWVDWEGKERRTAIHRKVK